MKLLIVSTWCPVLPDNGARLRAYHLIRTLAQRHDVTLVSFADREPPKAALDVLRALVTRMEIVIGSPFAQRSLTRRGLFSTTPRSLVQAHHAGMQQTVNRLAPHCDVALGLELPAAMYLRHLNMPKVFEEAEVSVLRDQARHASGLARTRRWLMWRKSARFMRQLISQFERTTVVSPQERSLLIDIGVEPSRLAVVHNGVDDDDFLYPPRPRVPRIIYPGSLTYSANFDAVHEFLRTTWPLLRQRPGLEFMVTGSIDGVDLSRLPPCDGVRFTGRVDDVKALIAESTAVVVPLRVGGGTRLKVLEAMALGTPVVSTSKGAEGLALVNGEHLLIAESPASWTGHVFALLDEAGLSERLAGAARAFVARHYRWTDSAAALESLLEHARSAPVKRAS
ncbi:MAG: glycosyltransferase family 4 protein [Vicinamibacterales bacterium]